MTYDVQFKDGDEIWIPAKVLYAEIHSGRILYCRIAETETLIPQEIVMPKEKKPSSGAVF